MAAKKVWLRTNGLTDRFVWQGVTVTREGTEVEGAERVKELMATAQLMGVAIVETDAPAPVFQEQANAGESGMQEGGN